MRVNPVSYALLNFRRVYAPNSSCQLCAYFWPVIALSMKLMILSRMSDISAKLLYFTILVTNKCIRVFQVRIKHL